ncbi:hypothetical protein [Polyangium sp. 15x6]|uniref:hypothetical protein n=1 Tax=Polyangium sp. 15x6 TaxID=3042687 RepID=UPI00249A54A5|nr:hypothetical protein [Polyangium sp. 15x6]MDI3290170.1 hypothetical protein [Polyangium sp. 15x6]
MVRVLACAVSMMLPALGLACSSTRPPVEPPPPAASAPAPTEDPPPPVTPRAPVSTADCPFHWTPHEIGASVLRLPAEYGGRFMNPLYDAACACVRPGEAVYIVARIVPERGTIEAVTGDREDLPTHADPSIDACFAAVLGATTFEPFEVGSDVVCPEEPPPPPSKGPPFFRPPRLANCPARGEQTSKIVYPLLVDRRKEAPTPAPAEGP